MIVGINNASKLYGITKRSFFYIWLALATLPAWTGRFAVSQDAAAAETAPSAGDESVEASPPPSEPTQKVQLDFREQPWLAVLEWLAEMQKFNLDWQQLPEGTLNLSSTKKYSVDEAEDVINMQLLARGFTLLKRGEVLRLVPLKNLDITLVPKVDPDELATLQRHQFVRVTFPLDWMIAEEAATEFKPLISPYGQLFPMASSNRLEAMDAVVNLRELHRLLTRAEADEGRRERVAEFRLEHRKAEEVAVKVRQLLGLPAEEAPPVATQTQLDIEKVKFRSEAVKQLGTGAQQLLVDKPDVHLVVNDKENSILVNGRPDKIEIARQAIEAMDKPLPPAESAWESINRVKVYEVNGFDPATITQLMQSLQERGNISKETRIQHEATSNRLVVVASPQDQLTIGNIIEGFRTQGRRAEVLPLARIDPRYASKAVSLVLKKPDRPPSAPGVASEGEFQVEPDSANNRLLLWATPAEMAEVREFLTRLGESFAGTAGATNPQMHVVHLRGAKASQATRRLQQVWKQVSDTPLVIEPMGEAAPASATTVKTDNMTPVTPTVAPATPPATQGDVSAAQSTAPVTQRPIPSNLSPTPASAPAISPTEPAAPDPDSDRTAEPMSDGKIGQTTAKFVVQQTSVPPQPVPPTQPQPQASAPASIPAPQLASTEPPRGVRVLASDDEENVVILSRDPAAAETARQLMEQIVPDENDVAVIPLKYAQSALVKQQLDVLVAHSRDAESSPLTTQRPLLIESDSRTNRLMVQHASSRQMRIIKEMVPLLDQPEQEDDRLVRQQRIYRADRKRASEIAEVVKEVYRDLLSSGDKIFDGRNADQPFGYNRAMAATSKSPEYQGLLAVGVDDEDNTLVLSAPAYLMDEVLKLVQLVDKNASNQKVVVVPLKRATARASVGEALGRLLAKPE
jgi:type II secretory pathway component GspD/PulD (secretin)